MFTSFADREESDFLLPKPLRRALNFRLVVFIFAAETVTLSDTLVMPQFQLNVDVDVGVDVEEEKNDKQEIEGSLLFIYVRRLFGCCSHSHSHYSYLGTQKQ